MIFVIFKLLINSCESKKKCLFIEKPSIQLAPDFPRRINVKASNYENCKKKCCDTKSCFGVNYIQQKLVLKILNIYTIVF